MNTTISEKRANAAGVECRHCKQTFREFRDYKACQEEQRSKPQVAQRHGRKSAEKKRYVCNAAHQPGEHRYIGLDGGGLKKCICGNIFVPEGFEVAGRFPSCVKLRSVAPDSEGFREHKYLRV